MASCDLRVPIVKVVFSESEMGSRVMEGDVESVLGKGSSRRHPEMAERTTRRVVYMMGRREWGEVGGSRGEEQRSRRAEEQRSKREEKR